MKNRDIKQWGFYLIEIWKISAKSNLTKVDMWHYMNYDLWIDDI